MICGAGVVRTRPFRRDRGGVGAPACRRQGPQREARRGRPYRSMRGRRSASEKLLFTARDRPDPAGTILEYRKLLYDSRLRRLTTILASLPVCDGEPEFAESNGIAADATVSIRPHGLDLLRVRPRCRPSSRRSVRLPPPWERRERATIRSVGPDRPPRHRRSRRPESGARLPRRSRPRG